MNEDREPLVKLAGELTDRVDSLERENASLREQLAEMTKQASVQPSPAPAVSAEAVEGTLEALVKAGALTEDQVDVSRSTLMSDMDAPHRIIQRFIDAQLQEKTASIQDRENLNGGTLATGAIPEPSPREACFERMAKILNMI